MSRLPAETGRRALREHPAAKRRREEEQQQFENDLLQSVRDMRAGRFARITYVDVPVHPPMADTWQDRLALHRAVRAMNVAAPDERPNTAPDDEKPAGPKA